MQFLIRLLGLTDATSAERRATFWTALMFGAAMASTFVLRPVRDQFGVDRGVEHMPYLYGLTLLVTTAFTPAFWWLASRMPSRRFVPIALHALAASMLIVFGGLSLVGDYDWKAPGAQWVGEAFWGYFSAFNVAVPTLVWVHTVEHFSRRQGLRLFGIVGVGGTSGAVLGSLLAEQIPALALPPSAAAIGSLVMLELAFVCYHRSRRACAAMCAESLVQPSSEGTARGGFFGGLALLRRDGHLRAIGGYMMLLAMVASAFAVARTELVGEQVASSRAQHGWLAHTELMSQSLVLALQLFCTGRLLRRLPAAAALVLMPLLNALGLAVLSLSPTVGAIALVTILLRGGQFALEKPSREALYTPLALETKHKVKFLLDTFALRFGDWLGACFQVYVMRRFELSAAWVLTFTVALAVAWASIGFVLGRRADRDGGRA